MSSERLLRRVCVVGHRCSLLFVFTCASEVYVSFPVPAGSVGRSASCVPVLIGLVVDVADVRGYVVRSDPVHQSWSSHNISHVSRAGGGRGPRDQKQLFILLFFSHLSLAHAVFDVRKLPFVSVCKKPDQPVAFADLLCFVIYRNKLFVANGHRVVIVLDGKIKLDYKSAVLLCVCVSLTMKGGRSP